MTPSRFLRCGLLLSGLFFGAQAWFPAPVRAQPPRAVTPGESAKLLEDVRNQIARGRAQLDSGQSAAVETLRNAAQQSLDSLVSYVGPQVLTASPEEMPSTGFWAAATYQTAQAHYWWGRAADQFGRRDEAIAALARATRFAGKMRPNAPDMLPRDSLLALSAALREGLPIVAPDDTLITVAELAHGGLWKPRRFEFTFPNTNFAPRAASAQLTSSAQPLKAEFLITSGRVFPPVPPTGTDAVASLSRVPPIYRDVPAEALPEVLRLDRMVIGYARENSGPAAGQWRQVVRVFYPSNYLTRDQRDDAPRAEAIAAHFLKVHALFKNKLGTGNPYNSADITTLWLSEVSALWPRDDSDPRVRAVIGSAMPRVNTPTSVQPGARQNLEIDVDPVSFPWRAATPQTNSSQANPSQLSQSQANQSQFNSPLSNSSLSNSSPAVSPPTTAAPGDVLLFNLAAPRDEAEWLREIMHEYGHVVVPAIDGFQPPLEPYANGLLGETLGVLWAASAPEAWALPDGFTVNNPSGVKAALNNHIAQNALASLRAWKSRGPISPLRRDTSSSGLQYLQGLTVYIERVYGAKVLSAAFAPMVERSVAPPADLLGRSGLSTDSLVGMFATILRDPFNAGGVAQNGALPVWLPGALENATISPTDLSARANLKLKAGDRVTAQLFVPQGATALKVEWKTTSPAPDGLVVESLRPTSSRAVAGGNNAAFWDVRNRSGWQKFTFTARTDLEIVASQFEKAAR